MPYNYNFKECIGTIHTIDINPKGWKNPITIEYATAQPNKFDTMLSIVWRVKGTNHTFVIHERRLNLISHADYKSHFTEALENFREDYLSWFNKEEYRNAEWKDEYKEQYDRFIIK